MCVQAIVLVCVCDVLNDLVGFIGDLLWLVIAAKSKFSCLDVWFFILFTFFLFLFSFFLFFWYVLFSHSPVQLFVFCLFCFFFSLYSQNEYLQLSTNRCHKCSKKTKQMFFTFEKFEWQMAIHT